jgi:hypothetical protein
MNRLRLYDVRNSRLPSLLGLCTSNIQEIANAVNTAQRRLIFAKEAGEEGWWGTWSEIVFNVTRSTPYITLPREVARLEAIDVCGRPVALNNQFFEYLLFGNGRMPQQDRWRNCWCPRTSAFTRNNAVTFLEMENAPQYITAYPTDAQDAGKSVLVQGLDADGSTVYSQNGPRQVNGIFMPLVPPTPSQTPMTFSSLTGIQKDVTVGPVRFYQHDPTTGDETLLLTMEPTETVASYRRYYLNGLPQNCCYSPNGNDLVQVTALAKMEIIPVVVDTDYLLIQNLEAIIEECQSVRYSEMDATSSKAMAEERHKQAIGYLNGELDHYLGKRFPAVNFAPFGNAHLRKQKIGTMI